ncbi:MAG: tetratricopeptide repeat protein [Chlorobiaceae bacterium]|nr:tetratricopeptide repeat protein [Chlorobiaceae bacterium]
MSRYIYPQRVGATELLQFSGRLKATLGLHGAWLPCLLSVVLISGQVLAKTPVEIFKQVSHSVVVIKTYDDKGQLKAFGSGVVLDKEGNVVTNNHVIEKAARLVVVFDKKEYPATPKCVDLIRDVCSINAPGLNALPVSFARSSQIEIGSTVYAIGSPMAEGLTFSDGIVSFLREALGGHYIQFTAPISPGSSGGGLFNEQAQLIGIPTYFISQGQHLNFALPVEWVVDLPDRYIAQSTAEHIGNSDADYLGKAVALAKKEDWRALDQLCLRWTKAFPMSVRAWDLLGSAYSGSGEFGKAVDAYRQAVMIKPDLAQYWLELGHLYGKTGQRDKQIESYRMAVRINPEYAETWQKLAVVYLDKAQYSNALEASLEVTRINPANVPAMMIQGYCYGKLEQQARQIEAYLQAIHIDEYSAEAFVCLGIAYGDSHRNTEEEEAYQQALRVNPNEGFALFNLGHYYLGKGNKEKGMEYYSRLKAVDPELVRIFFDDLSYRLHPAIAQRH